MGKSSGKVLPVFRVFGQRRRRGKVASSIGHVADEQVAYPETSRRFEQLSCTKYFHPSYGLKDMIF